MTSSGCPLASLGIWSSGSTIETMPLLPWEPDILSPTSSGAVTVASTFTPFLVRSTSVTTPGWSCCQVSDRSSSTRRPIVPGLGWVTRTARTMGSPLRSTVPGRTTPSLSRAASCSAENSEGFHAV